MKLHEQYRDRGLVVVITLKKDDESKNQAIHYFRSKKLPFMLTRDGKARLKGKVLSMPASAVFDATGKAVGTGNPARVELPEGTVARLIEEASDQLARLEDRRVWGEPGCDLEQLHWLAEPGGRVMTFRVSKGPNSVANLRPLPLNRLVSKLLLTLPEDGNEPRLHNLRGRVEEALLVLGGAIAVE